MIGQPLAAIALAALSAVHPATHASTPTHVAPVRIAWYAATRPTAATPPAPAPGVGPHDLLVQGFTVTTSQLPLALPSLPPIKQITAFTALTYRLPPGTSPASLTLKLSKGFSSAKIDARLPSGASPIACIATSNFKSGGDQPISAAPKYDCSKRSIVGQLNTSGDAIVFPGVSRLLDNHTLSLVILPGSLGVERLVFNKPTKSSLSLLNFASLPVTSPTLPPLPPAPGVTSPSGGAVGNSVPPAPTAAIPAVSSVAVPPVPASPPSVAPTSQSQALVTAAKPIDDTRARTGAIGGLVFLLVVTAWLIASRPKPATEFGVGKFRTARSGPPPAI